MFVCLKRLFCSTKIDLPSLKTKQYSHLRENLSVFDISASLVQMFHLLSLVILKHWTSQY